MEAGRVEGSNSSCALTLVLMNGLVDEGAKFEGMMASAQRLMVALGDASATLRRWRHVWRRQAP